MSLDLLGASLYLACGGAVFLLGVLVLRESPGSRLHRITATMMFFGGFGPLMGGIRSLIGLYGPPGLVLNADFSATFAVLWQMFFPSLFLFSLAFPVERAILKKYSRLILLLFAPHIFHLLLVLILGLYGGDAGDWLPRRAGGGEGGGIVQQTIAATYTLTGLSLQLLTRFHIRFFSFVDVMYSVFAIILLTKSFRAMESPKIRRQLSVILFGLGSCVAIYTLTVPVPTIVSFTIPEVLRVILISAALLLGTGSIAFAIVSRSFLDVGTVVRRAILLSGTSGLLVLFYFLTARQLDRLLGTITAIDLPIFQTLFVLLAIVFFHPFLGRLEETADRLLAGDRVAHRNVMRRLGREMTAILDLPTLRQTVLATLRDALAVERAYMVLRAQDGKVFNVWGDDSEEIGPIDSDHPFLGVIATTNEAELAGTLVDEIRGAANRVEGRVLARSLGARLIVPVQLPEQAGCGGFLSFGPKVTGARFNVEEVTLLSILATQVGIAVRNARLHEEAVERRVVDEELAMATSIQEAILSSERPEYDGVDVSALSIPSRQVGGDYFDIIKMEDGKLGLAIGDVSGKGVPAALLMAMLHAALHAQMSGVVSPATVMKRMNEILCRSTSAEKFATFFFALYDREKRVLRFTNGGHNFPILLRYNGEVHYLEEGGLVIGMLEESTYQEKSVSLDQGDMLVLYTDGVTEESASGNDDELYGEERLVELLRKTGKDRAKDIVRDVRRSVESFTGGGGFSDDFTLIVLKVN